jgi:hypothetical protein
VWGPLAGFEARAAGLGVVVGVGEEVAVAGLLAMAEVERKATGRR